MSMDINYYLSKTPEALKNIDLKREIIDNDNKYIFIWFCQRATPEQIKALLDECGVEILSQTNNIKDKLNGILTSGTEFNICEDQRFCQMVLDNNMLEYTGGLNEQAALSLANYTMENESERFINLFNSYSAENQIKVFETMTFKTEEKMNMIKRCKKETAEFMLNRDVIDLCEFSIKDIEYLMQRKVEIHSKNFTPQFINKIASIFDVNTYRLLINQFEEYYDVSDIEEVRRRICEKELSTINEEGLLEKFSNLKSGIKSGEISFNDMEAIRQMPGFNGAESLIHEALLSKNLDEFIKKANDYCISNIILDYYFKDVPTNALKNINAMMVYNNETHFLSDEDKEIYEFIQNIDKLDSKHKVMLFELLKEQDIDMTEKFYDDFTKARDTMVDQINDSIISKDDMKQLYNEELSKQAGVPIYCLNGQSYKALVRNIGVRKDKILTEENLNFIFDGSSFTIDGSDSLQVFGDIKEEYVIAFCGIPKKQLIHSFFGDSFTSYNRNENGVPENRDSAQRTIGFYTPEQLTSMGDSYSELLIAVPNMRKKSNEFEDGLEKPEAFAIYCYDQIKDSDIESAKELGLSIIVVNTRAYEIDRSGRASTHDNNLRYVNGRYDKDERFER